MRTTVRIILALACMLAAGYAGAWSAPGHMLVGQIADARLASTNAGAKVKALLTDAAGSTDYEGTLQDAAPWPDCAKAVVPGPNNTFIIPAHPHYIAAVCDMYLKDSGRAQEMINYVSQNYNNCEYSGTHANCDKAFHFADIPYQKKKYADDLAGATNADVVHAIYAAIAVLRGQPAPAPFNLGMDQKQALRLLVHFIGDLHQPLHVGSVYLDPKGKVLIPTPADLDPETSTVGGNELIMGSEELHSQWDEISATLSQPASVKAMVAEAAKLPALSGAPEDAIAGWASETVVAAGQAFKGLKFGKHGSKGWPITFTDRKTYDTNKAKVQRQQIIKGGERLAQVLQAIWP